MKSKIALLAISWSCVSQAQPTFEKIYLATGSFKRNLIELPSGNILTSMASYPGITVLNPAGDLMYSKCFWGDSVLTMKSIRPITENNYLFLSAYRQDSCSSFGATTVPFTHPAIGRMDSLGNISSFNHYRLATAGCLTSAGDLEVMNDSGAMIWGQDTNFFAFRIDADLNPVWGRRFTEDGGIHFIKELSNGDLIAGINLRSGGASLLRMDQQGNFIWCKSYFRPSGVVHDAFIDPDGSIIVTGYTDSTTTSIFEPLPASFQPKLFMMKLNGDGAVQWCRGFDSAPDYWNTPWWSRILRSSDGNFVIAATMGTPGINLPYLPLLMKLNSNGDTLWTSAVGGNSYLHFLSDLLEYSDGGFLINGGIQGDLPEAWSGAQFVFKSDSVGRFPCLQQDHSIGTIELFPIDSNVTLTAIDGITMHGSYVNDTTFAPFATYDACTVTTVIPPNLNRYRARPSIRPNPTTGRFTVEFPDPLMAQSYYSVYDSMGRLLYQRPLPTGATLEEVDLSRFGRGTYTIRFTSPDGVQHERVVLE